MERKVRFAATATALFAASLGIVFVADYVAVLVFFAVFFAAGAYTIYLFTRLEQRISRGEEWGKYYELAERMIYITILLYFLLFVISAENIWLVFAAGETVNTVFLGVEAFISTFIFLMAIEYVQEEAVFVEEYVYTA